MNNIYINHPNLFTTLSHFNPAIDGDGDKIVCESFPHVAFNSMFVAYDGAIIS